MAQYRELEVFAQFGSELDETSKVQLERGKRLTKVLVQGRFETLPLADEIIIIYAGVSGMLDKITFNALPRFEKEIISYIKNEEPSLYEYLGSNNKWSEEIQKKLDFIIHRFLSEKWHEGKHV